MGTVDPMHLPRALASAALALTTALPLAGCSSNEPRSGDARLSAAPAAQTRVVAISVDGLGTSALRRLGATGAPTLHRLLREGAGTRNARTEVEQTVTLPNHTSMLTGRRIDARKGGHGVTWNDDRSGSTVHESAGEQVDSVFTSVHAAGGSTALYSTKTKFSLFDRSWSADIDRFRVRENQRRLVRLARTDLVDGAPTFTFLHVSLPDRYGHEYGGLSAQYLDAVRRTDDQLGTIVRALAGTETVVVLTADHGFAAGRKDHSDRSNVVNYRIPFVVWGDGIEHGDLYELNPAYADPGRTFPSYAGAQPVRNGNVANLVAGLLGLDPVPGSQIGVKDPLVTD